MNMQTNKKIHTYLKNGVSYYHVGKGKWNFDTIRLDGTSFTKTEKVGGRKNADRVASIVGGSVKRNFVGFIGLDSMARGQMEKVVTPKTYKGNNLSHAGHYITGNH